MTSPVADFELDPAVVPIPDDTTGSVDDWLASLRSDGPPVELTISAAELVAQARHETE
jgi:hypothetical protein